MKILKVKIQRNQSVGKTSYVYPKEYDPKRIQVLAYETTNMDNYQDVVDRGNDHEYMVGIVKDEDIDDFLKSDDIEEMDYDTALLTCGTWVKQRTVVTDQDKVATITLKLLNKETITNEEKKIVDPSYDEKGINLTKTFQEMLDNCLSK